MGSTIAAGAAYAMHGEPMIPFYIFYSMFGFQRTGDSIWAMADQLARGFLIGATAGRTTLTGEGLQHADGHSPLLASTNPAVVHYDPAFAYEVGHIVKDGLRRMYGHDGPGPPGRRGPDLLPHRLQRAGPPAGRAGAPGRRGLLKGMYRYAYSTPGRRQAAGPGAGLRRGDDRCAQGPADPGRRVGRRRRRLVGDLVERAAPGGGRDRAAGTSPTRTRSGAGPYVTQALHGAHGPVVAVSDYMRAVQDQIAPLGAADLVLAGHRRVRPRRHPGGGPAPLPGRRRVDRGGHAAEPGPGRRVRRRRSQRRPSSATSSTTRPRSPAWPRRAPGA